MKKGEIVFYAVCVAFFGFMFYEGLDLRTHGRSGEIGSALWPLVALGAGAVLSLLMLVKSVRIGRATVSGAPELTLEAAAAKKRARVTVSLSILCFLIYILMMPWIGFILATFFYTLAFALALGERRRWVLTVSPFLVTAAIIAVFAKFITIPFPKGVGIFADFSRLFY